MKKLNIFILSGLALLSTSCGDLFLDLEPQDQKTDIVFFKKAEDFKQYTVNFYTSQLLGWHSPYGSYKIYNFMDSSSDLDASMQSQSDVGRGTIAVTESDDRWQWCYNYIRNVNILLERAEQYPGNRDEISIYEGEAYFFRAYNYFMLLKTFGGVPIVKAVLDVDSPELNSPRNSRYEVVDLILSDLQNAIELLPTEQEISATDKGRISKWGAEAFKARVLLYEATWRRYNGTSTDFDPTVGTDKITDEVINGYLDEAITLSQDVIRNGGYQLWNHNSELDNLSSRYLFNLEDGGSNPAGLTKSSNNEFIIYGVYDYTLRQGGTNLSHTMSLMSPSRKMMDLFLCLDGLPIDKSNQFEGYHKAGDEFKNRDYRMAAYISGGQVGTELKTGLAGYGCEKFRAYNYPSYRDANKESANYPVLRLAEVYLNYAEACYERYGNEMLTRTFAVNPLEGINNLRERAGITQDITSDFIAIHGLELKEEIRRERAVELYLEGFRYDDLKRWGIAEDVLNASRCGMVVGGKGYDTDYRDGTTGEAKTAYNPGSYVWGEEEVNTPTGKMVCVVTSKSSNHSFTKTHYLWPIPQHQINLSGGALVQNPGY